MRIRPFAVLVLALVGCGDPDGSLRACGDPSCDAGGDTRPADAAAGAVDASLADAGPADAAPADAAPPVLGPDAALAPPDAAPAVGPDAAVPPPPDAAVPDAAADEGQSLANARDDELAGEAQDNRDKPAGGGESAIGWGRTDTAELRRFLPIGRNANADRFVVMRLEPGDIPNLRRGDVVRAAAELQVTTRCDIGQNAPGCDYDPNVRLQLVLTGDRDGTDPSRQGSVALSDVKSFTCTKQEHHCVAVINFPDGSKTLADGPGCLNDDSCFINLVAWAFHPDARRDGDVLILGANEGDFLANGQIEQDRGRIMVVRERDVAPADKILRVTSDNVRAGGIPIDSDGQEKRIYSHRLAGGRDLHAGDKFRVWSVVDADTDGRVNLSLRMFLTHDPDDVDNGQLDAIQPGAISEHNGTNCTPSMPCHLKKVAVFQVQRDIQGPVYVNVAASCEVPGPGVAHVTVRNSGSVKSLRYLR